MDEQTRSHFQSLLGEPEVAAPERDLPDSERALPRRIAELYDELHGQIKKIDRHKKPMHADLAWITVLEPKLHQIARLAARVEQIEARLEAQTEHSGACAGASKPAGGKRTNK